MAEMMMPPMGGQEEQPMEMGMEEQPQQDMGEGQPQGMGAGDSFDAEAAAPFMEEGAGEIAQDGQGMEEQHSMEETVQAVVNFLYETATAKELDLTVQAQAVNTISSALSTLLNAQPQGEDAEMKQQAHFIDMHHKTRMNDLEYEGRQAQLKREEEKHILDAMYQQQTHEQNLQNQQHRNEIEMVNNQQKSRQSEEQHQANLEKQKRDSLKSPSKAGQSK